MTNQTAALPFDRRQLFARLAVARAQFMIQLVGLDEDMLTKGAVFEDWSPADLLGHVQAWDMTYAQRFTMALAGRDAEIPGVDMETLAEHNETLRRERRSWTTEQLVSATTDARSQVIDLLGRFSDADLQRQLQLTWGSPTVAAWVERLRQHDADHAIDIETWQKAQEIRASIGPKAILLASLDASRAALMAAVDLVPPDERGTRLVLGDWTLKDVLGHGLGMVDRRRAALYQRRPGAAGRVIRNHRVLEPAARRGAQNRIVGRGLVRLPSSPRRIDGCAGRYFAGCAGSAPSRPGRRESQRVWLGVYRVGTRS